MPYMLDNDAFGDREYWDRVTMEQIQELRLRLQQWPERHELCYPDELQRVMEDDDYCRNIVCQVRLNMPSAHKFVADMLRWRRAMRLHELREEILPKAVLERCIVYPHGKDTAGSHVLVLRNKNYIKGLADRDSVKRVFIFFIEKLFNECGAKKITVLMDCSDIGVSNIDVDLLKFVVDVFISKYPIGLGNALIYNMPWLLNAILRMIKSILPYGAERLKTVNKDDVQQYIDAKYLPVHMGGTDTYEYSYIPGRPLGDRAHY
ncbi:motile sperm domain-containing protein 2-like isoform X1 [Dermacentor variabilis]|uniref:motile sperm domain-containing protein 2-like isoform X1 n=1 Tax=Dermacentor variabilis TaxID=34621 RepID=UPI003F5B1AB3